MRDSMRITKYWEPYMFPKDSRIMTQRHNKKYLYPQRARQSKNGMEKSAVTLNINLNTITFVRVTNIHEYILSIMKSGCSFSPLKT